MAVMPTIWAMSAGACLILALPTLAVWLTYRRSVASLLFALTALGAAGVAFGELAMMQAVSGEVFVRAMKLVHLPLALLIISLVWFIVQYLGTRLRWIAWVLTVGWLVVLLLNLFSPYSIVFGEVPRVSQLVLPWGESVAVANARPGPFRFVPDLFTPVFLLFAAHAAWLAWQRGRKRSAALIGGGSVFFLSLAGLHSPLVDLGVLRSPYLISLAFLGVVLAMGLELVFEAARASDLSQEVKLNERRWRSLLENVQLLVIGVDARGRINYVNPFFTKVTGSNGGEVLAKPITELVSESDTADLEASLDGAAEGNLDQSAVERRLQTNDGSERVIVWSRVRLEEPSGEYAGLIGIGADVTEQRLAETARDAATKETEKALREIKALKHRLEDEVVYLQDEVKYAGGFDEIVGESDPLVYVLKKVEEVAPLDATVLIEGETGVGKELFARAIHARSSRGHRPLVKVNCSALPPNLIESELFGHEKGAFTGAARLRRGRFELADGGTIFLDEIAELPLDLQGKLLRVLQEGELERVGGDRTLRANVRVIAATNRSLQREVEKGNFREDLFYRLHVYPITVPPLRQRKEDIPLLVNAFVKRFAQRQGKRIDEVPQAVMDELTSYEWPGNVRELENVIQRAVITCTGHTLRLAAHLAPSKLVPDRRDAGYRGTLDEVDRTYILDVLELTGWRIEGEKGAAELLGLHPNTLRFRMRKLGIQRPVASAG